MDRQAECAVNGEVMWALKRALFLMQCAVISHV
jgi:hypothetical protein